MSCAKCDAYFGEWRSGGPAFPDDAWEILRKEEFEVGTHASVTVMMGEAKCRVCGQLASFDCSYGPGYSFSTALSAATEGEFAARRNALR